jgi:putative ABC transport system ATP-binding protein
VDTNALTDRRLRGATTPVQAPLIECRALTRSYQRGGERVHALRAFDLSLERGTFAAVMGPSGSGKSTLLNLLAGLDVASSGRVLIDGNDVGTLSESERCAWRSAQIGFVFQFYNLIPRLTAAQNVEVPLLLGPLARSARAQAVKAALDLVGLPDRAQFLPAELSGGQQQRVALARAIVANPPLLLCDEPTGNLDRAAADHVLELLGELSGRYGKTIVMVTHDPAAARHADVTIELRKA